MMGLTLIKKLVKNQYLLVHTFWISYENIPLQRRGGFCQIKKVMPTTYKLITIL